MDSYASSVVALNRAFDPDRARAGTCPCEWKDIKADFPIYCRKCLNKWLPFHLTEFGWNYYGYAIPPIHWTSVVFIGCNKNNFIIDDNGYIIGILDVYDYPKNNHREIQCARRDCKFRCDMHSILGIDRVLTRTDGEILPVKKEELEEINRLKKGNGFDPIVFHEGEGNWIENHHNYDCRKGYHCHCNYDHVSLRNFRVGVLQAFGGIDLCNQVREFQQIMRELNAVKPANSAFPSEVSVATTDSAASSAKPATP
jgi:hypothetical protein